MDYFNSDEAFPEYSFNYGGIVLRDIIPSDKADYIRWYTIETEWQCWDAPWERNSAFDALKFSEKFDSWLSGLKVPIRLGFELEQDGVHIGWVGSYLLDETPGKRAIGIDLPCPAARGKGAGAFALAGFLHYLRRYAAEQEFYTQTWSGNTRMIQLAEKLGFQECRRFSASREVHTSYADGFYDALTFWLDIPLFLSRYPEEPAMWCPKA